MQSSSRMMKRLARTIEQQQRQFLGQRVLRFANTTGRTADPADHSIEPEEVQPSDAIRDTKQRHQRSSDNSGPTTKDNEPYVPPCPSIIRSAPKVESNAVGPRTDPLSQQKRRREFSTASGGSSNIIRDVSCAGIDGGPWPEQDREPTRREQREQQVRDDREYFEHHKASPLSEIEISDTRKPITRATDGDGAPSSSFGYGGTEVVMFGPEQMDTAEDSLLRAAEMFRTSAMRGDPDSPHGRVLRQLRGEYW